MPANNTASVNVTGSNSADLSMTKTGVAKPVVRRRQLHVHADAAQQRPGSAAPSAQMVTGDRHDPGRRTSRSAPPSPAPAGPCTVPVTPPFPVGRPGDRHVHAHVDRHAGRFRQQLARDHGAGGRDRRRNVANTACVALPGPTGTVGRQRRQQLRQRTTSSSTDAATAADLRVAVQDGQPRIRCRPAGPDLRDHGQNNGPGIATNVTVTDSLRVSSRRA